MVHVDTHREELERFAKDAGVSAAKIMALQKVFEVKAVETVTSRAKELASNQGGVAAKAAADIRPGGEGEVVYGGSPYDMGAEFGSYQYKQFQRWKGSGDDAGYFFWPTIREFREHGSSPLWMLTVWQAIKIAFPQG